jgi:hypothetical protein
MLLNEPRHYIRVAGSGSKEEQDCSAQSSPYDQTFTRPLAFSASAMAATSA